MWTISLREFAFSSAKLTVLARFVPDCRAPSGALFRDPYSPQPRVAWYANVKGGVVGWGLVRWGRLVPWVGHVTRMGFSCFNSAPPKNFILDYVEGMDGTWFAPSGVFYFFWG